MPLTKYPRRGVDYSRLGITGSGNKAMVGHIMAIGSGTYRKPHYHGSGAQVVVLDGKGYTLMWPKYDTNEGPKPKDGKFVRVDWHKGSLLVPPEGWYHSHFTTSAEPGCIWPYGAASAASANGIYPPCRKAKAAR